MDNFISATAQTKIRVAQDVVRASFLSAKSRKAARSVLNEWTEKAKAAGFGDLRSWVEASQAAGHRTTAMNSPRWD